MNRTIVLCSFNRPIQEATRNAITQLREHGAAYIPQSGAADVTLARNLALSGGCRWLRHINDNAIERGGTQTMRDTFLMVDDDMLFTPEHAQILINHSRTHQRPASAMYATLHGTIAASPFHDHPADDDKTIALLRAANVQPQRWVAGLGLLAIPVALLLELEAKQPKFKFPDLTQEGRPLIDNTAFTSSGAMNGEWWSEDYTLCRNLGGVHLLPMAVGHLKTIPIYPDEETVRRIRDGERLGDKPPVVERRGV